MPCMVEVPHLPAVLCVMNDTTWFNPNQLVMPWLTLRLSCRGTATALQSRLHMPRGMHCQEEPRHGPSSSAEAVSCLAMCMPIPDCMLPLGTLIKSALSMSQAKPYLVQQGSVPMQHLVWSPAYLLPCLQHCLAAGKLFQDSVTRAQDRPFGGDVKHPTDPTNHAYVLSLALNRVSS